MIDFNLDGGVLYRFFRVGSDWMILIIPLELIPLQ